ncbi:hypothetical protein Tco_1107842 [Tanacetum coccineum]
MDLMIPNGRKNTLAEYMILSGADNRPPMLDKHLYDSWKSIMELYMLNREHRRMILESVEHGPLIWPTIEENGVTRTKKYVELSATEKIQADCDVKETNIILQGLPTDIYSLVNHHRVAKDLWEKVQLLMQELYANEVCLIRERNQDPLALVSHQYGSTHPKKHYSTTYPSTPLAITYPSAPYPNAYSSTVHQETYPQQQSVPQIEYTVSTVNQQTYLAKFPQMESGLAVPVFKQGDDPIDAINKMISQSQRGKKDATWFRDKVLLVEAQGNGKILNEEELEFLADPGIAEAKAVLMANLSNAEIHSDSNIIPYSQYLIETQTTAVQDTNFSAQQDAMILSVFEQLSEQVTNCNKVNKDNLMANETLSAKLERYKERVKLLEERQNVDLSIREKPIIDDIIRDKNAQFVDFEKEINSLKQTLSEQLKEKESLTKTFNVFKNKSKEKEA